MISAGRGEDKLHDIFKNFTTFLFISFLSIFIIIFCHFFCVSFLHFKYFSSSSSCFSFLLFHRVYCINCFTFDQIFLLPFYRLKFSLSLLFYYLKCDMDSPVSSCLSPCKNKRRSEREFSGGGLWVKGGKDRETKKSFLCFLVVCFRLVTACFMCLL